MGASYVGNREHQPQNKKHHQKSSSIFLLMKNLLLKVLGIFSFEALWSYTLDKNLLCKVFHRPDLVSIQVTAACGQGFLTMLSFLLILSRCCYVRQEILHRLQFRGELEGRKSGAFPVGVHRCAGPERKPKARRPSARDFERIPCLTVPALGGLP